MAKWIRYGVLGVSLLFILYFALRPAALMVEVGKVVRGEFKQQIIEDGRTRARNVYVVRATVPGHLERVLLKPGDQAKKGDVVAKIYPNAAVLLDIRSEHEIEERIQSLSAAYERAKVLVETARVAFITATSDYRRNSELVKKGYISKSDFEHQKLQLDLRKKELEAAEFSATAGQHEIEQAKATLVQIQSQPQQQPKEHYVKIFAPISGQVLKVDQESAGPIQSGAAILEMANVNDLEFVADILSTDAVLVQPGDPVTVTHWGGEAPLNGIVRLVEPGGFMKISALGVEEQRVNVVINITSPRKTWQTLGAEFRVVVNIEVFKQENTLQVPVSALFRHHGAWSVFRLKNRRAYLTTIKIGRRNDQFAEVKSGLAEGDEVILYPGDRITDGVRVMRSVGQNSV